MSTKTGDTRKVLWINRTTHNYKNVLVVGSGEDRVDIQIMGPSGSTVKLKIVAPEHILVDREEIRDLKGFY